MPMQKAATLGRDSQSQAFPPSNRARISALSPMVRTVAPSRSRRCRRDSIDSEYERSRASPATRQRGMFTRKIQRQEANWENSPPNAGPTTDEIAQTLAM